MAKKKGARVRVRRSVSAPSVRRPAAATGGLAARARPAAALAGPLRPGRDGQRGRSPPPSGDGPTGVRAAAKGPGSGHSSRGPPVRLPERDDHVPRPTIFYNATLDPSGFEEMLPRRGEKITMVLGDSPHDHGKVDVEMIHVEPSNEEGAIGVVRYVGTGDAHLHE